MLLTLSNLFADSLSSFLPPSLFFCSLFHTSYQHTSLNRQGLSWWCGLLNLADTGMGNCCHKDTKYATYKKELGAPLLKEMKMKGLPEGTVSIEKRILDHSEFVILGTRVVVLKLMGGHDIDGAELTGSSDPVRISPPHCA
jgi:hypothetical protein